MTLKINQEINFFKPSYQKFLKTYDSQAFVQNCIKTKLFKK